METSESSKLCWSRQRSPTSREVHQDDQECKLRTRSRDLSHGCTSVNYLTLHTLLNEIQQIHGKSPPVHNCQIPQMLKGKPPSNRIRYWAYMALATVWRVCGGGLLRLTLQPSLWAGSLCHFHHKLVLVRATLWKQDVKFDTSGHLK